MPASDTDKAWSPLAEGRELKFVVRHYAHVHGPSPLAEGRELKLGVVLHMRDLLESPLAEGRELKSVQRRDADPHGIVAPRGGA